MIRSQHEQYIGSLPDDWELVPVERLGDVCSGGTPSRSEPAFWNGSIAWVIPSELTELRGKMLVETKERITEAGLSGSGARIVPSGSLLVTTRATIGEVAIAAMPVTTNQGFKIIVPNGSANSDFFFHLLKHISDELSRLASGTTFQEISRSDLVAIVVPRPRVAEQRHIAEILDTVDEAIEQTDALSDKLKQIEVGLRHGLLTQGLDDRGELRDPVAHSEQFEDTALGPVPREWDLMKLGELVDSAVDGPFGSHLKTEHYVEEPGVRVVRLQNVGVGYFDDEDKAFVSDAHAARLRRHQVVAGDLLAASLGDERHPFGRACLYPNGIEPGVVKADCFRLRLRRSLAIEPYVMHVLNCEWTRGDVNRLGQGVTRDRVNLTMLQQVRLRVPSIQEQKRIVAALDACHGRIMSELACRDKFQLLKKGLISDLLTGRVRVEATEEATA